MEQRCPGSLSEGALSTPYARRIAENTLIDDESPSIGFRILYMQDLRVVKRVDEEAGNVCFVVCGGGGVRIPFNSVD